MNDSGAVSPSPALRWVDNVAHAGEVTDLPENASVWRQRQPCCFTLCTRDGRLVASGRGSLALAWRSCFTSAVCGRHPWATAVWVGRRGLAIRWHRDTLYRPDSVMGFCSRKATQPIRRRVWSQQFSGHGAPGSPLVQQRRAYPATADGYRSPMGGLVQPFFCWFTLRSSTAPFRRR
jgi:hypothetical protein